MHLSNHIVIAIPRLLFQQLDEDETTFIHNLCLKNYLQSILKVVHKYIQPHVIDLGRDVTSCDLLGHAVRLFQKNCLGTILHIHWTRNPMPTCTGDLEYCQSVQRRNEEHESGLDIKGSLYIAQHPVRWTAQSAVHFFLPWQTCSFRHQPGFSGKHSSQAAITCND